MTQQGKRNIQDDLLNTAKQKKSYITLFTVNGVKFNGIIKDFDPYIVVMEFNKNKHDLSLSTLNENN